jgi:CRP-like cAMP-binding protein
MAFKELKKLGKIKSFKKGQIIYLAGEEPQGMYFLESGLVALTMINPDGKEHLLRFFKEGQFFSHRSLFAQEVYHASAKSLDDSRVVFVSKEQVLVYLEQNPHGYKEVVMVLAKELRKAEVMLALQDSEVLVRIAHSLIYLKELDSNRAWTREEIAQLASTTETTVIKILAKLELEGLIHQNGRKIEISNRDALISLQMF